MYICLNCNFDLLSVHHILMRISDDEECSVPDTIRHWIQIWEISWMGVSFLWHRVNNGLNAQESFHFSDKLMLNGIQVHVGRRLSKKRQWGDFHRESSAAFLFVAFEQFCFRGSGTLHSTSRALFYLLYIWCNIVYVLTRLPTSFRYWLRNSVCFQNLQVLALV